MSWVEPTPANIAAYERTKAADRLGFLSKKPEFGKDGFDWNPGNGEPVFAETSLRLSFGEWDVPKGLEGDEDLGALQSLHVLAQARFREMAHTIAAVRDDDDPGLNHDRRLDISTRIIEPKLNALASDAQRELGRIDDVIGNLEERITKATRAADAVEVAGQAEIRAHIKALNSRKDGDGDRAVRSAIESGDRQMLQAIATMPAYLSGVGDATHAEATAALRRHMAPADTARLEALRIGKAKAMQALDQLDRRANRLLDFGRARQMRERDAAREERYRSRAG